MATTTRIANNNNIQTEWSLLEKHVPNLFFQKSYKTNTKVKLKHEQKIIDSDKRRCGGICLAEQ